MEEFRRRYSRQLMLPEIGAAGQEKLGRSAVLIAGLGGLGSVSAYYMAAAGVGHLKVVDCDRVALDNLNRQILHGTGDIGRSKVESAAEKLRGLNPACRVETVPTRIDGANAPALARGCDLIVDATDNLAARHALNRAAFRQKIPFIYGGISGWGGMAATFVPGRTACLACLFPEERPRGESAPVPVVGPAAGVIGAVQSLESLLVLLGREPSLAGRMLHFQGLHMRFRTMHVDRNPDCTVCGTF